MKKLKPCTKITYCLALLPCLLMAGSEADNIILGSSYGDKVISEGHLKSNEKKKGGVLFDDEVILNWVYYFENDPKMQARAKDISVFQPAPMLAKAKEENGGQKPSAEALANETVVVKGFCFIPEDVDVGKQPSSLRVECQSNVGAITMFADLVNVNDRASLVADPKYIERNGVRFEVASSIVTNETKTSYNIATYVNDRKIAEIGWGGLSVGSDIVHKTTNEYLKALEDSKKKQEVALVSIQNGNGSTQFMPVQTSNTEKPDPLNYLAKAAIDITASVVKNTAEIFKKDLPYLYQIKGKSKIWIDLKVKRQGEYVR